MLKGTTIQLRPLREADLDKLHSHILDLESRGDWYPRPRTSAVAFRRAYEESGFWQPDEGIFLIVDGERMVGTADYTRLNGDIPDVEMGYRIFDTADRGRGVATDAVRLLTRWLFETQQMNRLRLTIHVDNAASKRVAEKAGFTFEAVSHRAWYHRGRWHDVAVYTLTRDEFELTTSKNTAAAG